MIAMIITILMVVLKLCGAVTLSWPVVLIPAWVLVGQAIEGVSAKILENA